jgi:2-oxoglutarate ferredoxin oxidoreductase subunit alpha
VRSVVRDLRATGERIGFVRPITLWPFPSAPIAATAASARTVAVFELCAGQMIDDVRLAVLGQAPVVGIGGISTDGSGFGVGRLLDTEIIRERLLAVHRGGAHATLPALPDNERGLW